LAERAVGQADEVALGVHEHGVLKNLDGILGGDKTDVFVQGGKENGVVEFFDEGGRLVVFVEPLAEGEGFKLVAVGFTDA